MRPEQNASRSGNRQSSPRLQTQDQTYRMFLLFKKKIQFATPPFYHDFLSYSVPMSFYSSAIKSPTLHNIALTHKCDKHSGVTALFGNATWWSIQTNLPSETLTKKHRQQRACNMQTCWWSPVPLPDICKHWAGRRQRTEAGESLLNGFDTETPNSMHSRGLGFLLYWVIWGKFQWSNILKHN